jgi:RNA polymerase sigma-70 factor (family 1)
LPSVKAKHRLAIRPIHNEKALLHKVALGDETAFEELFHAYHQPLAEWVLQVTDSLPWTEDIVQDVFIKVWMKRRELPGLQSFTDWLFILSRNYTLNGLRKRTSQRIRDTDWGQQAGEDPDREEAEWGEHYRVLLAQAVDRLPPQQQKVWKLSREEQYSYVEIARELNVAPSTVKSHMQAALASVKEYVRGHIDPAVLVILLTPLLLK